MTPPNGPAFLALICYEAVFSGDLGAEVNQAAYILNITNDAWFDGSIGLAQHADHARLRAVEEGLPLIRVANSGITEVVDPLGRVVESLPAGQQGVLNVTPPGKLDGTVFSRLRYWPLLIAVLIGLGVAVWSSRRRGDGQ
jgi:apolipoprotein N-acyltransferase